MNKSSTLEWIRNLELETLRAPGEIFPVVLVLESCLKPGSMYKDSIFDVQCIAADLISR
jgi:hypothetical protein